MKRAIRTIVIVIVFLIVGFIPYRYKKNDFDVIKSNNMDSDVSCYYSLIFQYSYRFVAKYNTESGIHMRTRYSIFGVVVIEERHEMLMLSSDEQELISYEKPVVVSSI